MASSMLQRRLLSTSTSPYVKQVTRANFVESLEEIKSLIASSQFVAISLKKTGAYSSPWHKVSSFDTPETAYLKSKHASERFQILQFSICPFTITASKLTAYPYNFHLFPRDELNLGMPCYSFTCQSSFLKTLAAEGFDFNACIYEGISYLSREQQSAAKFKTGSLLPAENIPKSTSEPSVANSIFLERIKLRIKSWRDACKASNNVRDETLFRSLRKLVMGLEECYSRPSLSIDVCNDHQAALVAEMVEEHYNDLTPLVVQSKKVLTKSVRLVLTSSKEDKDLLRKEVEDTEKQHNDKLSGFRNVIDALSHSQKPVVCLNSLHDLTFIYSKFIGSLPSSFDEFSRAMEATFPRVIDVGNLMKRVVPFKTGNVSVSLAMMKRRFFAPIDIEIPNHASWENDKIHDEPVLSTAHALAKLTRVMNVEEQNTNTGIKSVRIWDRSGRNVKCEDLVFLWGFGCGSAGSLKKWLEECECLGNAEFDVRLVERDCAIVAFWTAGASDAFRRVVERGSDEKMFGFKAVGFGSYDKVCKLGLWESSLLGALQKVQRCSLPQHIQVPDWFINL